MSRAKKETAPSYRDILSHLKFDPENGKIWLYENRMLLVHANVMGKLRTELIESLGMERAKGILMRFGYNSGQMDAELIRKIMPDLDAAKSFAAGPELHSIEGMVKVEPLTIEFNMDEGNFFGEFQWHDSWEVDSHIAQYGKGDHSSCWTLLGYANGYTSYYMGREIMFKEPSCISKGDDACINIGRPVDEWEDKEELEKYLTPDPVVRHLAELQDQIDQLKESYNDKESDSLVLFNSIGRSKPFLKACHLIQRASSSMVNVLILGETGVGKEVLARGLHEASPRKDKPFVAVNCASISTDLIEAELFGVVKGAYTGANNDRKGKFERADQGTIFLDEVIELSPRAQASLLRVLQEGELERVGDSQARKIDVRIVAATNEDLRKAVEIGRFRADLYYRLNVFPVEIPPLRERPEDIPPLIEHFLDKYHTRYNKHTLGITDKAKQALMVYKWPGNIRELENMIERGIILTDNNQTIELSSFFPSLVEPSHPLNMIDSEGALVDSNSEVKTTPQQEQQLMELLELCGGLEGIEQKLLDMVMQKADGNVSSAARTLNISRPTLAYKLKKAEPK